jgi:hypothetical protein
VELDAAKSERELGNSEMSDVSNTNEIEDPPMRHREITLADGRYLIFYTFGDEEPKDDQGDHQGEDV